MERNKTSNKSDGCTVISAWTVMSCAAIVACGCSAKTDVSGDGAGGLHTADSGACSRALAPSGNDQSSVQGALIAAKSGDTLCLAGGRFTFTDQLTLAQAGVTLRGADTTVLDFKGQTSGANGIEITADNDVIDTLRIENPKGDGVRATEVTHVTVRNVHVEWTSGPSAGNGGYGIYPVTSSHVLVENCYVSGASDTGIYIGQSNTIVVRNNEVTGNVAGIEIENSTDAEVYENRSHDNAAGILVFNLPGLNVKDGKRANVHDNVVESNNLPNFAPAGNIVHDVPEGTGMFITAADRNEIHGNTVRDNESVGIAIVSWFIAGRDSEGRADPEFDWYPEGNFVHDNQLAGNGSSPQGLGAAAATLVGRTTLSDLAWDGYVDWSKVFGDGGAPDAGADAGPDLAAIPSNLHNCFKSNNNATFLDIDLPRLGKHSSSEVRPFECEQPPLAPVNL
jgi:parallel beta-helix repeat protein